MNRKYIIGIIILLLIALIIYQLAGNKAKLDEKSKPRQTTAVSIPVKTTTVKEQFLEINIMKTGNLAPFKEAKVLATSSGTIQHLNFNLGDEVKQGQVLAVLDTRLMQLDLQKSQVSVNKLKNDLQTYTELLEGKAATREKVDEIRQNYQDALNQSSQIRKQIADAAVKAPTDGIISVKATEEGSFTNTGADIATIVNLSKAKVQVNLTETEVYAVKQGQQVKITTDAYPDKVFNGKISFISPQSDVTHNYMVEIMVDNTKQSVLRSGNFVYADFSKKTKQNILVIPREALTESIKNASVYIAKDNKAYLKPINTGREIGNMIEVTSGLQKDEQVVVSGQINLKDGTAISVSK